MASPHHRSNPGGRSHLPGQRVPSRAPRHHVLRARPVRLAAAGEPWMHADVLNISTGGLCLALPPHLAEQAEQLTHLDLHHLGGFGPEPLVASVQWTLNHRWIATMGIAFHEALEAIPTIHGTLSLQP